MRALTQSTTLKMTNQVIRLKMIAKQMKLSTALTTKKLMIKTKTNQTIQGLSLTRSIDAVVISRTIMPLMHLYERVLLRSDMMLTKQLTGTLSQSLKLSRMKRLIISKRRWTLKIRLLKMKKRRVRQFNQTMIENTRLKVAKLEWMKNRETKLMRVVGTQRFPKTPAIFQETNTVIHLQISL